MSLKTFIAVIVGLTAGFCLGIIRTDEPEPTAPRPVPVPAAAPSPTADNAVWLGEKTTLTARVESQKKQIDRLQADLAKRSDAASSTMPLRSPAQLPKVSAEERPPLIVSSDLERHVRYIQPRAYREYRPFRAYKKEPGKESRQGTERDCRLFPFDRACLGTEISCKRDRTLEQCAGTSVHCAGDPHAKECLGTEVFCITNPRDAACMGTVAWCLLTHNKECAGMKRFCDANPEDRTCVGTEAYCLRHLSEDLCQRDDT